eukprot:12419278-Karenia_brevis.AAC.1
MSVDEDMECLSQEKERRTKQQRDREDIEQRISALVRRMNEIHAGRQAQHEKKRKKDYILQPISIPVKRTH